MGKSSFEKDLQFILDRVAEYYPKFDERRRKKIAKAFYFSEKAHQEQLRQSGDPYFIHPVAATKILLSIRPDIDTICACLMHDVIEDTPITADEIEAEFDEHVRFLCEGVAKISKVQLKDKDKSEQHRENLKKLFIAVAKDIRVIFVKLADRIHNLQTLEHVPEHKRERIARESIEIYAPVAEKLGLFEFKNEIQDLSLRGMHPESYDRLKKEIEEIKIEKEVFFEKAEEEILEAFNRERLTVVDIQARQKHIYSVFEKLKRKNLTSAKEIYDLFGLRVLVQKRNSCYRALGILHSFWRPMPGRFKDYISVPKPNGYQSLHTTVLGLGGSKVPTEIQIRTVQMHMDAEYGPAAHWAYKKFKNSNFSSNYMERTNWFPEHITQKDMEDEEEESQDFFRRLSDTILADQVYVFTPKGDVKVLPADSTPVDFAYHIHSEVGNSCVGAKVNGVIKPLDYKLQNGEVIEVLTKQGRTPNATWLEFVKSNGAKSHIRAFINKEKDEKVEEIVPKEPRIRKARIKPLGAAPEQAKKLPDIRIGGESKMRYKMGKCCNPNPNKPIIAYKSRGLDFTIHEIDCEELEKLEPERFLEAHFILQEKVELKVYNKLGLIRDYTTFIANTGVNIYDIKVEYEKDTEKTVRLVFTLEGRSHREIDDMLSNLQKKDHSLISFRYLTE